MMVSADTPPWRPDWSSIPDEAVDELLREGREHLQGIIELGVNSDHRAASLCGVFGGGAFVLLAVASTIFSGSHSDPPLQWAALVAAFVLLYATYLCAKSAQPEDFHVSGYEPERLFAAATDLMWMRRYVIEDIETRIQVNRAEIYREARLTKRAIHVAAIAIILGLATYGATSLAATRWPNLGLASRPSLGEGSGPGGAAVLSPSVSVYSSSCVVLDWAGAEPKVPPPDKGCGVTIVVHHPMTVEILPTEVR